MSDAPVNKKEVKKDKIVHTNVIPVELRGKINGSFNAVRKESYILVNDIFYKEDQAFIAACEKAEIKPTRRQASKWRNQKGLAYMKGRF